MRCSMQPGIVLYIKPKNNRQKYMYSNVFILPTYVQYCARHTKKNKNMACIEPPVITATTQQQTRYSPQPRYRINVGNVVHRTNNKHQTIPTVQCSSRHLFKSLEQIMPCIGRKVIDTHAKIAALPNGFTPTTDRDSTSRRQIDIHLPFKGGIQMCKLQYIVGTNTICKAQVIHRSTDAHVIKMYMYTHDTRQVCDQPHARKELVSQHRHRKNSRNKCFKRSKVYLKSGRAQYYTAQEIQSCNI